MAMSRRQQKAMYAKLNNRQRSSLEVKFFKEDKPDRYFAYVNPDKKQITTWTGQKLGTIERLGPEYRDNLGGTRQNLRVKAVNGKTYSGTYYKSSGDYARLKAVRA